ncbi:hypothetical protein FDH38_gp107 [Dinoroseobacter phage vB_DshS-R5C]|uniref:Uncharacterized protein n=1 Tax=Dinoroseobacter phage vB_DshS-R5C TaxID=1965368 RepID=A0A1V0DYD1_9CAUD|nr:hypothetical protein FDH38_gp107 [Dinoroseobacter phage vB_DshS-R5C]ARB06161.1 hypothetical protein vBDshSR5C_107 [Dinoroseobacter phage vB_DshS-R5C]
MNAFLWIGLAAFCAGIGWTLGVFLIDLAIGSFVDDEEDDHARR